MNWVRGVYRGLGKEGGVEGDAEGQLRHCHLRCHSPLALELGLVPLERLLLTARQILAVVVLRHTMLCREISCALQTS